MSNVNVRDLMSDCSPRQVMFWDGEGYCAGIMVGKKIICGCCGAIYDRDEVKEDAMDAGVVPLKLFETWVDLSDEIKGDEKDSATAIPVEAEDM